MGIKKYALVVLWYVVPLIILFITEGIFLPRATTVVALFVVAFTIGYVTFEQATFPTFSWSIRDLSYSFFKFLVYIVAIVELYGIYRIYNDGFEIATYRMDFYESSGGIFKSNYLFTLYSVFLTPGLLLATIFFLSNNFDKKNKRLIYLCFFLIVLDGIIRLGRFQYIFVFFFLYLFHSQLGLKKRVLYIGASIIIAISFITVYIRQFFVDLAVGGISDIINYEVFRKSVLDYQYVGYFLFEHFTEDRPFFGNPLECNTISSLFLILKIFVSKIGINLNYAWEGYNLKLTDGKYIEALDYQYNAFSTNFFPIYLDAGYIGIFLYGLMAGVIFGLKSESIFIKFLQVLNFFILIFGIYQPIITSLSGLILIAGYIIVVTVLVKQIKYFVKFQSKQRLTG